MTKPNGANEGSEGTKEAVVEKKPEMSTISLIGPSQQQAKHWAKKYRTEIAASSSSVFSTFIAVG